MKNISITYEKQHKMNYDYYLNMSVIYFFGVVITPDNLLYKTWVSPYRIDSVVKDYFFKITEVLTPMSGVRYFRRF